jgi:Tfp pilus assembly protein PilX
MKMQHLRRAIAAGAAGLAVAACFSATATAAPPREVKALQAQVKSLRKDVASLKTQIASLKSAVAAAAQAADAASAAATSAGTNASAAVAKTNCLVNATAFVVWSNDVYAVDSQTLATGTGMDISAPSDPVSGYLAGVNSSCVPSVFPRFPGSASLALRSSPGEILSRSVAR